MLVAIPNYQELMLPVLELASDGLPHKSKDAIEFLADKFSLTQDERSEVLPSGNQLLFNNRVGWARSYLKQAGLLDSPKRGVFVITEQGLNFFKTNPPAITSLTLEQFPSFVDFKYKKNIHNSTIDQSSCISSSDSSPEETLADAYKILRNTLESELLKFVKDSSPSFFERLVVDLLVHMGYGGNRSDAGKAIGRSGDGGIDGIINEDKLGLEVIYIQAKKWESTVGRPEIHKFAGALMGQSAKKGVFITTSSYSKEAVEFANSVGTKIVLIDGNLLAKLMVDYDVGVSTVGRYEVKKIDADYFDE